MIIMIVHVCSNFDVELANRFTREGVEQIEKAVRERNSAGDMTELKLNTPAVEPQPLPQLFPRADYIIDIT